MTPDTQEQKQERAPSKRPQRQARRALFDPTGSPDRIIWVILEANKLGRPYKDMLNFVRNSLRIARRQGREEMRGRR